MEVAGRTERAVFVRRARRSGGFWLSLLLNLLLNADGLLPAVLLFGLHFWLGISVWWAVAAAVLWFTAIAVRMVVFRWANRCGNTTDPPKENKNPYSVGNGGEKRK